jgi:hypothetical protein
MMAGRMGPQFGIELVQEQTTTNTGVLHFVQDDDVERATADAKATATATARARATADPYGMTNKKDRQQQKQRQQQIPCGDDKQKGKSNGKCNGIGIRLAS